MKIHRPVFSKYNLRRSILKYEYEFNNELPRLEYEIEILKLSYEEQLQQQKDAGININGYSWRHANLQRELTMTNIKMLQNAIDMRMILLNTDTPSDYTLQRSRGNTHAPAIGVSGKAS